jgi:hypothetical protein
VTCQHDLVQARIVDLAPDGDGAVADREVIEVAGNSLSTGHIDRQHSPCRREPSDGVDGGLPATAVMSTAVGPVPALGYRPRSAREVTAAPTAAAANWGEVDEDIDQGKLLLWTNTSTNRKYLLSI